MTDFQGGVAGKKWGNSADKRNGSRSFRSAGDCPRFKIVRTPSSLKPFSRSLTSDFHWDHAQYFVQLVLAMAVSWGQHNLANLYRHLPGELTIPDLELDSSCPASMPRYHEPRPGSDA